MDTPAWYADPLFITVASSFAAALFSGFFASLITTWLHNRFLINQEWRQLRIQKLERIIILSLDAMRPLHELISDKITSKQSDETSDEAIKETSKKLQSTYFMALEVRCLVMVYLPHLIESEKDLRETAEEVRNIIANIIEAIHSKNHNNIKENINKLNNEYLQKHEQIFLDLVAEIKKSIDGIYFQPFSGKPIFIPPPL